MSKSDKSQADQEWEARTLCSDDGCIGIIGPDGRCLECGRPYDGDLPENFAAATSPLETAADEKQADEANDAIAPHTAGLAPETPQAVDDEWAARELCPDESCIGVIGPDGRCLECGRTAADG